MTEAEKQSVLEESIMRVLLLNARLNDSNRIFAGIRRPSKTTRKMMYSLANLYNKRSVRTKNANV